MANPNDIIGILGNQETMQIVGTKAFDAKPGNFAPIPNSLHPAVRDWLNAKFPNGLFTHQAHAIERFLEGADLGLMTPTASGKSAIFQAGAAHLVKSKPGTKVLALFPLVALAKDQEKSWKRMEEALGVRIGLIHGGVASGQRAKILEESDIVLATPDCWHAGILSRLSEAAFRAFRKNLGLVILDEAHTADGVFGSNMAYFMARLRACGPDFRIICASATLGEPEEFLETLTGKHLEVIENSGASLARKTIIAAKFIKDEKQKLVEAISKMAASHSGQTIVFVDQRTETDYLAQLAGDQGQFHAYRAGYENQDRELIQEALTQGKLTGVVATSALEAGIDIGSIGLVIMVGRPARMRSFLQRHGRLRNEVEGVSVIFDEEWPQDEQQFEEWLQTPVETNKLYLENPALQIGNAFCVRQEKAALQGDYHSEDFTHLPESFQNALHLAEHPEECFNDQIRLLIERVAMDTPQHSFALRSFEVQYDVKDASAGHVRIGTLSQSQVWQEGFPGAIYRYMNRAYRVCRVDHLDRVVHTRKVSRKISERTTATRFISGNADFAHAKQILQNDQLLLAEAPVNLADHVRGFTKRLGNRCEAFVYGQSYQAPALYRTIPTSGVCIIGPQLSKNTVQTILSAYAEVEGIHEGDLVPAPLRWKTNVEQLALLEEANSGWVIADRQEGSLGLTSNLIAKWAMVLNVALNLAEDGDACKELAKLTAASSGMQAMSVQTTHVAKPEGLVEILAPGSEAQYVSNGGERLVVVDGYIYHPSLGWCYRLQGGNEFVKADHIFAIPGMSQKIWYDRDKMMPATPDQAAA